MPFLEAIRQLRNELDRDHTLFIHVTLLPYIAAAGELKTKPSQHSVKGLLSVGIQPDILLCRSDRPIPAEEKRKLGLFCNIKADHVIEAQDVDTIYQVPISYHEQGLDTQVCNYFNLSTPQPDLTEWHRIVDRVRSPEGEVIIAVVGKYVQLLDAYKSLSEALIHGGIANHVRVKILWVDSKDKDTVLESLAPVHGILVAGGFGDRGVEGKILAIQFAREKKIPFLGICFGMQLAIVECSRNLLGLTDASSTEFGPTPNPVVAMLTEWMDGETLQKRYAGGNLGGTMRLGAYECHLTPHSLAEKIYGQPIIFERHRHRYEVNTTYKAQLEAHGIQFSGMSPDGQLPEIIEIPDHPWFVGVQFHPELKSKPLDPHPLFTAFIKAALDQERLV